MLDAVLRDIVVVLRMCDGARYVMGWYLSSDITEVDFILANHVL